MARHEIFDAIEAGDEERVRELVSAAGERGDDGVSALLHALYQGRSDLAAALRPGKPELDVFEAAALGETQRVRELLDADPSLANTFGPDGFTPLTLAAFFKHEDSVRLLLDRGADVSLRARHEHIHVLPIHAAAANGGSAAIVRLLLDRGADPNATQPGGFTALHAAEQTGNRELADLLLAAGAAPGARTDDGSTPADLAPP